MGLDGGGTKTAFALADRAGRTLGPFLGAGINPFDQPRWREEFERLIAFCPVPRDRIAFCAFGMPGYGESREVSAQQLEAARSIAGQDCAVLNDVAVAFAGALAGEPGVLVLAGTGSMAWGANAAGQVVRVGGWGEGFGDEGSAHWIGLQALQKLSWALDGRLSNDAFCRALLETIGVNGAEDLLSWFYGLEHRRSRVAALASAVDRLADAGNITAQTMLLEAAELLAAHAQTVHRRLNLDSSARLSYAGSTFKSRTVTDGLRSRLETLGRWAAPVASPLAGALFEAARGAGWDADRAWLEKVQVSLDGDA